MKVLVCGGKGTANMINQSLAANLHVIIIESD